MRVLAQSQIQRSQFPLCCVIAITDFDFASQVFINSNSTVRALDCSELEPLGPVASPGFLSTP